VPALVSAEARRIGSLVTWFMSYKFNLNKRTIVLFCMIVEQMVKSLRF
jgi:hypothetical protein